MKLNTDKMQAVSAAAYLTAPDAVLYRSIMRILYNSKEAYRSQLSIDEILSELHEHEEFESKAFIKKGLILLGRALRRPGRRGGRI